MTQRLDTFPKCLRHFARTSPERIALQEKRFGIWQPITWSQYERRTRRFAQGLAALGLKRGEVMAILGDNRPECLIAELAVQSIGGMSLCLYPDGVVGEVAHVLQHGRVRFIVAEDQEQVDKLIELWDEGRIPVVERVVYFDPRGLEVLDLPYLVEFTEVEALGDAHEADNPGWFDAQLDVGEATDTAILCTTSGTTGRPKVAMLTYHNLMSMGRRLMEIDPIEADDEYVSFLPLAWIGEQMISLACGLQRGFVISSPEDAATLRADLREIGPRVIFSPPRIWQDLLSSVQVRLGDAGWLKRMTFAWGYSIGDRVANMRLRGKRPGLSVRILHRIADLVALRPVRDQLGLLRLRRAYTGGAPLGPDVFKFFRAIGVNLKQIYGQTEICGIAVLHRDDDINFNTVGCPLPGTEIKIEESGEILLKSDAVFIGYFANDEATAEALSGGWLHTGDAGYLDDDGHLVVIDRAKDVMRARDGTHFSPAFIENKLKFSPYIEEAVVFGGEDQPEVTAMISIDMQTVGTWAERQHLTYTTYTDLAQKSVVYDLIAEHVAVINDDLPASTRIRKFVLLHKQLDADDEELTRTRKVRRRTIRERYSDIISALSEVEGDKVTIRATVTYQDGSKVERDVALRIFSMNGSHRAEPSRRKRLSWSAR
jgi:long-chain acyl-CoA synthetase